VIVSRHIVPHHTEVPPGHTGVVFLERGESEEEQGGRREVGTYMHGTCGPSLGELGGGDIHGDIGSHVWSVLGDPDTTKNIWNIGTSLSNDGGGGSEGRGSQQQEIESQRERERAEQSRNLKSEMLLGKVPSSVSQMVIFPQALF
jgi:hypothetical protein